MTALIERLRVIFGRSRTTTAEAPILPAIVSTEAVPAEPLLPATAFDVKWALEERPKFRRFYSRQLDARAHIKLEARSFWSLGRRAWSGELRQPGGRWVFFDPERVADKILDPLLVPLVEAACAEAIRLDREFIRSRPAEFVDEDGTTWRRLA